ncbi:MAG: hypothetical protein ABJA62_10625 [Luteimonas sp.]
MAGCSRPMARHRYSERVFASGRRAGSCSPYTRGNHCGVSYDAYQLPSKSGTSQEYLNQSRYGTQFSDLRLQPQRTASHVIHTVHLRLIACYGANFFCCASPHLVERVFVLAIAHDQPAHVILVRAHKRKA